MRIRLKLILAFAFALSLLLIQGLGSGWFVWQLQSAVDVVVLTSNAKEQTYAALDLIQELRKHVEQMSESGNSDGVETLDVYWDTLQEKAGEIEHAGEALNLDEDQRTAQSHAFDETSSELAAFRKEAQRAQPDEETLLEQAMYLDEAFNGLAEVVSVLDVTFRERLESAIADERAVHDRPIQVGMVIGILAAGVLVVFASVFSSRFVLRILALNQTVEQIAAGDLSVRPAQEGDDEVAQLAKSIHTMTDKLSGMIEQAELDSNRMKLVQSELEVKMSQAERHANMMSEMTRELEQSALEIEQGSGLVNDASIQMAGSTSEQVERLEEISQAMESMATMFKQNTEHTVTADQISSEAQKAANSGQDHMTPWSRR